MNSNYHPDNTNGRPRFDVPVRDDGYRWWYIDGLSDDGRSGIVVIAFVGSVFSPYYYAARGRGPADPEDHVAINVGLYRPTDKLWAMTERGRTTLSRDAASFAVGPSSLEWIGDTLRIDIAERSMPLARTLRGRITVRPQGINHQSFPLDRGGRHTWQPVAPVARIEVAFEQPSWFWQGDAYIDTNAGERPLEADFHSWHWSRSAHPERTLIHYAVTDVEARQRSLALAFTADGRHEKLTMPPVVDLPGTGWRVPRQAAADSVPVVERTLEDTPFYSRSILGMTEPGGVSRRIMHESLSLARFQKPWVRTLLPFRMPRRAGR